MQLDGAEAPKTIELWLRDVSTNPRVRQFLDRIPDRIVDGAAFQRHLRQLSGVTEGQG